MRYVDVNCNLCGSTKYSLLASGPDFEYRCVNDEFRIVKCDGCGLVFLNPRPAPSELATIYPDEYIPYRFDDYLSGPVNSLRMAVQRSKVKSVKKLAGFNAAIWDVGCGGGFFLYCLKQYGLPTWKLAGVDVSEKAIQKTKAMGIEAIHGRFETISAPPEIVDLIVLNQVIEHLDDPSAVLDKASHILKKGGYIFIETPSLDGWDARIFGSRYWGGWHFPRHWTLFTDRTLTKLLEKKNFRVIEKVYLLSPNFWAQSFHHCLIDKGVSERIAGLFDCRNPLALSLFSGVDLLQKVFGHTSNMRLVGKKI